MRKNGATTLSELIKTNAPQHIIEARLREQAATHHRCPFCRADPGEPCRSRTTGQDVDRVHARRLDLIKDPETQPPAVEALCCECGHLRTVSPNYYRPSSDPNYSWGTLDDQRGWRATGSLKCAECGTKTRHAFLLKQDGKCRDYMADVQQFALGHGWDGKYGPDIDRVRAEYFAQFPRNPYLRHRRWTEDAKKAWAEGHKQVTALCGEQITIHVDPNLPSTEKTEDRGRRVADQLSDTEYEDPETGLWWIDMACVDCCRVSNNLHWAAQRKRLEWYLAKFACSPELVPDSDVGEWVELLEKLWEQAFGQGKASDG